MLGEDVFHCSTLAANAGARTGAPRVAGRFIDRALYTVITERIAVPMPEITSGLPDAAQPLAPMT